MFSRIILRTEIIFKNKNQENCIEKGKETKWQCYCKEFKIYQCQEHLGLMKHEICYYWKRWNSRKEGIGEQ